MLSFLLGLYQVELLDHVVTMFTILRNCHTVIQSGRNLLYSHHQYRNFSISLSTLTSFKKKKKVILPAWSGISLWFDCISLMVNDVEHLLMCLLAFVYLLWITSVQILCSFQKWLIYLLLLSCDSSLHIFRDKSLIDKIYNLQNVFSHL